MNTRIFTLLFAFLAIAGNAVWGQETSWTGEGSGTKEAPYIISTADELKAFRDLVNDGDYDACAKLTADITLDSSEEWTPIIATTTSGMGYVGTFDGDGKTIKGLSIKERNTFNGLFGIIGMINMSGTTSSTDGIVKNLTIEGEIKTTSHAGGICYINYGTIENCINKVSISSLEENQSPLLTPYIGGICYQNHGTIQNCGNKGTLFSLAEVGGICASNFGTIKKCYNIGTITGGDDAENTDQQGSCVGGICVVNFVYPPITTGATIENCYNAGTIISKDGNAAGICCRGLSPITETTIKNCHNYGTVQGKVSENAIAKDNDVNDKIFTVENCYYLDTENDDIEGTEPKSAEAFASGEVLYLLQQNNPDVWVQTIGTDDYPKFETEGTSSIIYQVTFDYNYEGSPDAIIEYVEAGESITIPTLTRDDYIFTNWSTDATGENMADISGTITPIASITYYAQWQAEQTEDPDDDNDTPGDIDHPQRPIKYYNIYVDTICPGLDVETSKDVVAEGHQVSAYLTIQAECDTTGMRFEYKRGLFGYWQDLKELEGVQPGEYIIKNIYTDIYIRALDATLPEEEPTGLDDLEGIQAYAKEGNIYVYTPNREEVMIISMSSAILKHEEQIGWQSYDVNRGIYIVRVGEKVFKLKN